MVSVILGIFLQLRETACGPKHLNVSLLPLPVVGGQEQSPWVSIPCQPRGAGGATQHCLTSSPELCPSCPSASCCLNCTGLCSSHLHSKYRVVLYRTFYFALSKLIRLQISLTYLTVLSAKSYKLGSKFQPGEECALGCPHFNKCCDIPKTQKQKVAELTVK